MPGGVPVATMAVGKAGALNAAIFAAQIIATSDKTVAEKITNYKQELANKIEKKSAQVKATFSV